MKKTRGIPAIYKHQTDASLSQDNPVSGTKYEVLATTENVRIISIIAMVTWTVQPTPLEIHITIDGIASKGSFTDPVSATGYFAKIQGGLTDLFELHTTDYAYARAFLIEGRSIKIEVETTGGTVSNISARVKYQKIP